MHNKSVLLGSIAIVAVAIVLIVFGRSGPSKDISTTPDSSLPTTNNSSSMDQTSDNKDTRTVTLVTNVGNITLELFTKDMPITTANFIKLAQDGFYNNTKFHRVIAGFMIQGGDPNSKGADVNTY